MVTEQHPTTIISVPTDDVDDVRDFLSLPPMWRRRIIALINTPTVAPTSPGDDATVKQ